MAKKIRTVVTLQLPAGKATPAPPVGTALGPHGINIVEFTKSYNEKTAAQAGQVDPGPDHDLRGPQLHVHPQDPARRGHAAQGGRGRAGLEGHRPREGRVGRARPGARDRADQDGRSQCHRPRRGHPDHRGHRPLHGHRGPAASARTLPRQPAPGTGEPRPARPPRVARGRPARAVTEVSTMPQHGKRYKELAKLVDRETAYAPEQAVEPAQGDGEGQLRPVRRGPYPPRRRPPPRGPDGARHRRAAARRGQDRPRPRLRAGRQGPGGAQGRRR